MSNLKNNNSNNNNPQGSWIIQIRDYFNNIQLSEQKSNELEKLLLNSHLSGQKSIFPTFVFKNSYFTHFSAAAAAAALTFFAFNFFKNDNDPITDLTAHNMVKNYPADFDLEGDATSFPQIIEDVLPKDTFTAVIPSEVLAHFVPKDGRFFQWSGAPGVSINLKKNLSDIESNATLYMIKLTDSNDMRFPTGIVEKNILGSKGKTKQVKAWRDGKYGYALVQSTTVADAE